MRVRALSVAVSVALSLVVAVATPPPPGHAGDSVTSDAAAADSSQRPEVRFTWQLPASAPVGSLVSTRIRTTSPTSGRRQVFLEQLVNGRWQLVLRGLVNRVSPAKEFVQLTSGPSTYRLRSSTGPALVRTLRGTGTAPELPTQRISVTADESQVDDHSYAASVSDDGRFVAFASRASNLIARRDTNRAADVYLKNLETGAVRRVSSGLRGQQARGESQQPVISGDGRFVAFVSDAPNLVRGDTDTRVDVFVWNRETNEVSRIAQRASHPTISHDGRYVAFTSGTGAGSAVRLRDRATGALTQLSTGGARAAAPSLSADGRFVAFESAGRVALHDRATGTTRVVSTTTAGAPVTARRPQLSADGSTVAFESDAPALGAGGNVQIYRRTLTSETTTIVSTRDGAPGDDDSSLDALSADGTTVLFTSAAALVDDDVDNFDVCESEGNCYSRFSAQDTYVADATEPGSAGPGGAVSLVSRSATGRAGEFSSTGDDLLPDGSRVFFTSIDALVPGQTTRAYLKPVYAYADVFTRAQP